MKVSAPFESRNVTGLFCYWVSLFFQAVETSETLLWVYVSTSYSEVLVAYMESRLLRCLRVKQAWESSFLKILFPENWPVQGAFLWLSICHLWYKSTNECTSAQSMPQQIFPTVLKSGKASKQEQKTDCKSVNWKLSSIGTQQKSTRIEIRSKLHVIMLLYSRTIA